MRIQEGRVGVKGGNIWYRSTGEGGIPLVALHGGPGATHDYLNCLTALVDSRTVVLYDQLGSGLSDRPQDPFLWTADRFVEELESLLEHLGLERFHLLGQSWGTMLAVLYAGKNGNERIASMVLSAPYLNSSWWYEDQRRHVLSLPEKARRDILDCEARGDYSSPAYAEAMDGFYRRHVCRMPIWPEDLERTMRSMGIAVYNTMWGPSEFTLTGNLKGMDVTGYLPQLRIPVLYTCGEFDEATPATTRRYAELTPGSKVRVFKGASHMHHLEDEEGYLSSLRNFINENDG